MFTGLIEQLGRIRRVERRGADSRLIVECSYDQLLLGESVAVDGACLTVDEIFSDGFAAMASAETIERTTLGRASPGRLVHLERALALGSRLGGHIVTGHVDALGKVKERQPKGQALRVTYELPEELAPFVAEKGSIAIDGVSLTVNGVVPGAFWIMLVPFTRKETHLDRKQPGEPVNLETDVLAKYVARLLGQGTIDQQPRAGESQGYQEVERTGMGEGDNLEGVTMELLIKQGFAR